MAEADRLRWDAKYAHKEVPTELAPDSWLREALANRPPGRALDLACGLGDNAIWLAQQGWRVDGVDISASGLRLATQRGQALGLEIRWRQADLDEFLPDKEAYDLVIVFRFLDRVRLPEMIERALRPGGLLIYETFTVRQLEREGDHLKNAAFALQHDELPKLFPRTKVLEYQEFDLADRCVARLCGRKI